MKTCATIAEARAVCRALRASGKRLALVPTMGALHEGHLSLIRAAKAQGDAVAASIFVNPMQFAPSEDLSKYPRQFERDRQMLEAGGIDVLFAPSVEEMYPAARGQVAAGARAATESTTSVHVESLSEKLDGRSRPGHFRGVATVVAKLFNIIEPDAAFFGQKDAAQLAIIRRMVHDLNFPVEIVACPIVREPDGLAMSSRNAYLTTEERRRAVLLHQALQGVSQAYREGEKDAAKLVAAGERVFAKGSGQLPDKELPDNDPQVRLDYFEIVDPETLDPVATVSRPSLVAVAAHIGSTRLIDNLLLAG